MKTYDAFPKTIGNYTVGRTQIDFKYVASDNSERELTAFFFYPSDSSEGKPTAEYAFPELPSLWNESMVKNGLEMDNFFDFNIKTCCYEDLELSQKENRYPVVFYVHGGTTYPQQNTVTCQDLASAGYIVVAIGHQGGGVYRLKDGRLSHISKKYYEDLQEFGTDPVTKDIAPILVEKLEKEKALEISRKVTSSPGAVKFTKYADLQSEDIRYVADCLYKMNTGDIGSIFKDRLKLEIGIGVFGHSFGGATTAIVCRDDDRFVCGIDFDGGLFCQDSDLKKPFMMLGSTVSYNVDALFLESNSGETYFVILDNVVHFDFGDFIFLAKNEALQLSLRGTRDAMELRNILTTYTKAFFDKYMLKKSVEIESLAFDGVEMIKKSKK